MKCLGCKYPLKGLRNSKCPECGREFDPSDDQTFRSDGYQVQLRSSQLIAANAALVGLASLVPLAMISGEALFVPILLIAICFPFVLGGAILWMIALAIGALAPHKGLAIAMLSMCVAIEVFVCAAAGLFLAAHSAWGVLFLLWVIGLNAVAFRAIAHLGGYRKGRRTSKARVPTPVAVAEARPQRDARVLPPAPLEDDGPDVLQQLLDAAKKA